MEEYKICVKCNTEKPSDGFYQNWGKKNGRLSPYCKECYRKVNRKYGKDNPDKALKRVRKYFDKKTKKEKQEIYRNVYKSGIRNLSDSIVKKYIMEGYYDKTIKISNELIECKRTQILISREIKNKH